jgi:CRISPR-associated protein Csx17
VAQGVTEPDEETAIADRTSPLPMAVHLAPVDGRTVLYRSPYRTWDENGFARIVWGAGSLVQNMIAVLERRLVEQSVLGLSDKPFAGVARASLGDIAAFLEGPPQFDDARCAALVSGLVWARPVSLRLIGNAGAIPFAYAALKPLFTSDAELRSTSHPEASSRLILSETKRLPIPPGLISRLRSGAINVAVYEALGRAHASEVNSPFYKNSRNSIGAPRFAAGIQADRLASALLIPIDDHALRQLVTRAYPEVLSMEETNDVA